MRAIACGGDVSKAAADIRIDARPTYYGEAHGQE